jgi:hypothetical protein
MTNFDWLPETSVTIPFWSILLGTRDEGDSFLFHPIELWFLDFMVARQVFLATELFQKVG